MPLPLPPPDILSGASLFLDLDGTLVDFAPAPADILVCDGLRSLLTALSTRLDGRLAIVSGRSLDDLSSHLQLHDVPMSGSHGLERRRADSSLDGLILAASVPRAVEDATQFASEHGLLAETKPAGVAIHYRSKPEAEAIVDKAMERIAARHGLQVQKGSMVRELRQAGRHKGDVVRAFMRETPFASGNPIFVGDDLTDEDAFAAAAELGGAGILVGQERETAAGFRLPDVASVRSWLKEAL